MGWTCTTKKEREQMEHIEKLLWVSEESFKLGSWIFPIDTFNLGKKSITYVFEKANTDKIGKVEAKLKFRKKIIVKKILRVFSWFCFKSD
jgi:hypothetical protein